MTIFNANNGVRVTDASGHGLGNDTKSALGEFKITDTLTAGQDIRIAAIPRGAVLIDILIEVDGVTGGTFDIGVESNPTLFGAAIAPDTLVRTKHYRFEKSDLIVLKLASAPTGTEGKILFTAQYILD